MTTEQRGTQFCIADICLSITLDKLIKDIRLDKTYYDFLCDEKPEIVIHAYYSGVPQITLRDKDKIFDSQGSWSLYYTNQRNIFVQKDLGSDVTHPYMVAIFDADFREGELHRSIRGYERSPFDHLLPSPLDYPFGEVLMICLLARGRGLMVHACGIDDEGQGYLFAGNSTHGKSTMARIWKDQATILNDDRIVLRWSDGRFWMYGTPWHGDYSGVSPQGVPLDKIFFLNHAKVNRVHRKEGVTASSMLLARSFPPLWDPEGMRFTLDFCAQLVETIPCYELDFVPNESVVDFVRCVK